jgi:hypothetical protein
MSEVVIEGKKPVDLIYAPSVEQEAFRQNQFPSVCNGTMNCINQTDPLTSRGFSWSDCSILESKMEVRISANHPAYNVHSRVAKPTMALSHSV